MSQWSYVDVDGLTDVVCTVNWRYQATRENDGINTNIYGTASLASINKKDFTAYEKLTKKQVVDWVESVLNVQELKESLEKKINELNKPKNEILQTPF